MTASNAAEVLLKATARARSLRDRTLVVKLGGSAMEDPTATRGTLESIACLRSLGVQLVLVHGGGKPIDRAMAAAGLEPKKVLGRRYTDEKTLEIVVKVLHELNLGIIERLMSFGVSAHGFTDADCLPDECPIQGKRLTVPGADGKPVDLGFVGEVTEVDWDAFDESLAAEELPVVPSLACDANGGWLNVNADTVASAVAGWLKADACYFLTDTPGVLGNIQDPGSLIPRLTRAECQKLIADGVIAGGMIPKVEACFEALDSGSKRAVILDGRNPHALLGEFVGEPAGTEIVP